MKDLTSLMPEKMHFSLNEICEQFGISRQTLDHYIYDMNLIRLAIKTTELAPCHALELTDAEFHHLSEELRHYLLYKESSNICWPEDVISCIGLDKFNVTHVNDFLGVVRKKKGLFSAPKAAPDYIFLIPDKHFKLEDGGLEHFKGQPYDIFFEDFEGNKLLLTDGEPIKHPIPSIEPIKAIPRRELELKLVIPVTERERFIQNVIPSVKKDLKPDITTKTKNSYLKTIRALSEALIDGLTGVPGKDANAVLTALELKGISHPVTAKTLASYLQQSEEL